MTMSDRTELIARLEKATGADRELDAAITVALDIRPDWLKSANGEMYVGKGNIKMGPDVLWCEAGIKKGSGNPSAWYGGHSFAQEKVYPHFTSSLDAAMTLVPEVGEPTWTLKLALDHQTQTTREYFAEMQSGPIGHGREYFKSPRMKTPALALCIVALKAQETQSNG